MTDETELNKHQNRKEAIIISKIFNKLGYNVKVIRFDKPFFCIKRKYDIIFGLEPNFVNVSKKNLKALKIYYATGSYFGFQNNAIYKRTQECIDNNSNNNFKCERLVVPHRAVEISDSIIQIGNEFTKSTYPTEHRKKINLIRQSCFEFTNFSTKRKELAFKQNKFVWFGSGGSILKGLDLIIDVFLENSSLHLDIIGQVDESFWSIYKEKIKNVSNINYHGFLPVNGNELLNICESATFTIFPSASEGMPGSVINMMKLGIIPIVSRSAAIDEIGQYGFLISDLNHETITRCIKASQKLSKEEIISLMRKNSIFANENYNLATFEDDFETTISSILEKWNV